MSPRAVLFDLDDTLIDRRASLGRLTEVMASDYAGQLTTVDPRALYPIIRSVDGGGYQPRVRVAEDLARLLPWRNAPTPSELARFWEARFPACSQPSDGVYETLAWLRAQNLKIGIVTNGRTTAQERKIAHLGLAELVDAVIVSETVGIRKPDPRIFGLALDRLRVANSEAWFVGDNPANDVLGATAAGLTAVWFRRDNDWPGVDPPSTLQITSLRELIALLSPKDGKSRDDPPLDR